EREVALAKVHEMQKLESLGQLTGGVAHDFNNVLMAILGNLDLLVHHRQDRATERLLEGAIQAAERGATLTRRMLALARRQELRPEVVDGARQVEGMVEMLRRSLGPTIEIVVDLAERLPPIRVDPNQLELAVLNLALNARDAMPEGGRVVIAARPEHIEADTGEKLAPGDYVRLAVTDNSPGMAEATPSRAAEPFFTTKEVGKGTGLGLSTVYGLAAQSGGFARIASRPREGTTVELIFPAAQAEAVQHVPPLVQPAAGDTRSCTVLLVD